MLSCANLAKSYASERGKIEAVKGIDIAVEDGEFASIVGRSGSGKSSLPGHDRRLEPSVPRHCADRGYRYLAL